MSANLKTVACILSPLFWSRLYAAVSIRLRAAFITLTSCCLAISTPRLSLVFCDPGREAGEGGVVVLHRCHCCHACAIVGHAIARK